MKNESQLSTLWIFLVLNYLYCDVVALMDHHLLNKLLTGNVDGMEMSEGMLTGASVLMEVPIAMVVLSRMLKTELNRYANIFAGTLMTVVQTATLFPGTPTIYYIFFSVIEISVSSCIAYLAWSRRWVFKSAN